MNTTNESKIEPGTGYRLLEPHEVILETDERFCTSDLAWRVTANPGLTVKDAGYTYRRKLQTSEEAYAAQAKTLEIGEGYRVLGLDETVKLGDEYNDGDGWHRTTSNYGTVRYHNLDRAPWWVYRRKVAPAKPTIDPGEGYRLLGPDEVIEKGDDFWSAPLHQWLNCQESIGYAASRAQKHFSFGPVRRKVTLEPGEGYRLLEVGELIERTDEFYDGSNWRQTGSAGQNYHTQPDDKLEWHCPHRRKVTPAKPEAGEGYHLLKVGETIEQGDEFRAETEHAAEIAEDHAPYLPNAREIEAYPGELMELRKIRDSMTLVAGVANAALKKE